MFFMDFSFFAPQITFFPNSFMHFQPASSLFSALPSSSCLTLADSDWLLGPQVVFLCLQYFLYGIFLNPLYICKVSQN